MPKITVAIPTYNDANYIVDAIESVLTQNFKNFELLIIIDGSTDTTADLVATYTDERIRVIHFFENKGRPFVRNTALREAQGEYLTWLDADDISTPDRLEKLIHFMDAHPHISACGSAIEFFNEKSGKLIPQCTHENISAYAIWGCSIANATTCLRLEDIRTHNLQYNENMKRVEDYLFAIDLLFNTPLKTANITDTLYHYRYFNRPSSPEYHVKATQYLLAYLHLPHDILSAQKHAALTLKNYNSIQNFSAEEILQWTNTLYEKIVYHKTVPIESFIQAVNHFTDEFLDSRPNILNNLMYYKNLPLAKTRNIPIFIVKKITKRICSHSKSLQYLWNISRKMIHTIKK